MDEKGELDKIVPEWFFFFFLYYFSCFFFLLLLLILLFLSFFSFLSFETSSKSDIKARNRRYVGRIVSSLSKGRRQRILFRVSRIDIVD